MSMSSDVCLYCIVNLHRSPCFPMVMEIISGLPNIPKGEPKFGKERFWGVIRNEALNYKLDTIRILRQLIGSDRWVKRKPYCMGQIAVEKKVSTIFNSPTSGAVVINVVGIPGCSFSSGKGSTNESPREGFDDGWKSFRFPHPLKDLIDLW